MVTTVAGRVSVVRPSLEVVLATLNGTFREGGLDWDGRQGVPEQDFADRLKDSLQQSLAVRVSSRDSKTSFLGSPQPRIGNTRRQYSPHWIPSFVVPCNLGVLELVPAKRFGSEKVANWLFAYTEVLPQDAVMGALAYFAFRDEQVFAVRRHGRYVTLQTSSLEGQLKDLRVDPMFVWNIIPDAGVSLLARGQSPLGNFLYGKLTASLVSIIELGKASGELSDPEPREIDLSFPSNKYSTEYFEMVEKGGLVAHVDLKFSRGWCAATAFACGSLGKDCLDPIRDFYTALPSPRIEKPMAPPAFLGCSTEQGVPSGS